MYGSRNEENEERCAICSDLIDKKGDLIIVFPCDRKHYFHVDCGEEWLKLRQDCPICHYNFKKEIIQGADVLQDDFF